MKTSNFIGCIVLILAVSCESKQSESNELAEQMNTESNQAIAEETQSFESSFSIHDLFKNQNSDVVNAIAQEDFESAIKKVEYYWSNDDSSLTETQKANLRYMHIYAMAGLVTQKKKNHSDLEKLLESYKGEFLITQHLEITQGNMMPFNQIRVEQDKRDTIEITCTNNDGFNIHCFVRAALSEKFDLSQHIGKSGYLCGKLDDYKLSDEDVNSWISDLQLSEGFVKILEDEFEEE